METVETEEVKYTSTMISGNLLVLCIVYLVSLERKDSTLEVGYFST